MRFNLTLPAGGPWLAVLLLLFTFAGGVAQARDLKFQALLIWATNADKSPNPKHKPVSPEVRKKLKELPLRWSHFFEVNRAEFSVGKGQSKTRRLSNRCQIKVTDVNQEYIEVSLIGRGEPVLKRTQPLPKGDMLVLGGNAPNETGWLVVLKRVE